MSWLQSCRQVVNFFTWLGFQYLWDLSQDTAWGIIYGLCCCCCQVTSVMSDSVPPIDSSHQAPVPGILQARTLEWVAIACSSAWKWKVKVMSLSRVRLFATPWIVAYQAPPSMGFPRQEYWSGLPLPSPYLPYPSLSYTEFYTKFSVFFWSYSILLHHCQFSDVLSLT